MNVENNSNKEITTIEIAQGFPNNLNTANQKTNFAGAVVIAGSIFGTLILIWFLNTFLQICKPNQILILSGRKRKRKDGQEVGYRVIFGGRTICIPILETVKTMDLRTMLVQWKCVTLIPKEERLSIYRRSLT